MALLFFDGFDHSGTSWPAHTTKYTTAPGAPLLVTSPVRTGTGALHLFGGGTFLTKAGYAIASGTTAVLGVAFQKTGNVASLSTLFGWREGATTHVGVGMTAAGVLFVYRGTTATILVTGTTVLADNTWYYLEFKATVHDTTGSYALRIDGAPEVSGSSADTRNGLTGVISEFFLNSSQAASPSFYYDDLYVCDGTGAIRNDFLGPVKVETLYPQTDAVAAGSHAGLTPSTGTDHGALVDEVPPSSSDYNGSPTVGAMDTYHYPSPALTGAVLGIQTNLYVFKSDAAVRQVCAVVRAGGVDHDGASVAPGTTSTYRSEVRAQNPTTGVDWTLANLATIEAGMKVTV